MNTWTFGTSDLLDGIGVPALVTDINRVAMWANRQFLELFDIERSDLTVAGLDMAPLSLEVSRQFVDPEAFLTGITEAIEGGVPTSGELLEHRDGRLMSRAFAPIRQRGEVVAYLWRYDDVTLEHRRRVSLERSSAVLEAMVRAHGPGVRQATGREIFSALLDGLIHMSGSEYGFVGEIIHDDSGAHLRSWAVSDIAWDIASRNAFYAAMRDHGYLEFRDLNTLYGHTVRTGERVISNAPTTDPRAGGLPPGHPPLIAYMGLPMYLDGRLVGMAGLAGREGGYDEELAEMLDPLLKVCASMIDSYAIERERRSAEEALREAVAAAEAANTAKTRLLGRVSHELRTPLNAVLGYAQLLARGETDPRRARWIAQIDEAGAHVLTQIEDLLHIAAAESGQLIVTLESIPLDDMVGAVRELLDPLATARAVRVAAPISGLAVEADRAKLRVVLINLLSNAIKYNREGGNVTITARLSEVSGPDGSPMVEVVVADDGPGIEGGQFERAFAMFERLDVDAQRIPGTGLGLSIAREYTEAMGGSIHGREAVGGGAELVMLLPQAGSVVNLPQPAETNEPWVLYVEDNPANAELVVEYLREVDGLKVIVAPTLAEGRATLSRQAPHVLLLDLNLPDGFGGDLAAEVLRDRPGLPVVVITADSFAATELAANLPGLAGSLVKPVRLDALSAAVGQYISRG